MSDDEADIRPLSPQELAQVLGDRVRRPCPICDGTTWDVAGTTTTVLPTQDDPNGPVKVVIPEDEGGLEFEGIVALPMVCRACGFIAQFAYRSLSNEAKQHRDTS